MAVVICRCQWASSVSRVFPAYHCYFSFKIHFLLAAQAVIVASAVAVAALIDSLLLYLLNKIFSSSWTNSYRRVLSLLGSAPYLKWASKIYIYKKYLYLLFLIILPETWNLFQLIYQLSDGMFAWMSVVYQNIPSTYLKQNWQQSI